VLSPFVGPRRRYPLFVGLLAILSGGVVAAALSLWGSLEIQRQFDGVFTELIAQCAGSPPAAAEPICATLSRIDRTLLQRVAVMLMLQGFCFALILAGAALLARRAYVLLVRRTDAALGLTADNEDVRGRDEIGRLIESLAELSARQAALDTEERWQRRTSSDQLRRKSQALQALHEAGSMFCADGVSEFSLVRGLALFETALGARTVALGLSDAGREALGASAVLSTRGEPAILHALAHDAGARETAVRIVPPSAICDRPSLVVPVCCGDAFVGTLVAEFSETARVEDPQVDLAQSFSHLVALAISSASRSREEKRVALMEERGAIAAELHDSLAQAIGFMKIQVARLQRRLEGENAPPGAAQMAIELREGLSVAYRDVRELITAFRARMDTRGLLATLEEAIEEFGQRSCLDIGLVHDLGACHLQVNEEFHVMQIVREALSNAVRHAHASRIRVNVGYGPDHLFTLTVDDDGRGVGEPGADFDHYGLSIMRERAHSLGGQLEVAQRPGGGTRIELSFAPERLPIDTLEETSR
jgi:two-component system nitrate/nitrite sensor histidine kinase NarX